VVKDFIGARALARTAAPASGNSEKRTKCHMDDTFRFASSAPQVSIQGLSEGENIDLTNYS
jgi:hypothetical protein